MRALVLLCVVFSCAPQPAGVDGGEAGGGAATAGGSAAGGMGGGDATGGGAATAGGSATAGGAAGGSAGGSATAGGAADVDGGSCVRPSALNTGVPSGVSLTAHNGDMVANVAGQVIEGLDLHGSIHVTASNVTIRKSRIQGGSGLYAIEIDESTSGTVIEDCEIGPSTGGDSRRAIAGSHFTVRRTNVHNMQTAVFPTADVLIEHNWFHHPAGSEGSGVFSYQPQGPGTITLFCNDVAIGVPAAGTGTGPGNDAFEGVDTTGGVLADLVLDHNWFGGGSYAVYIHDKWSSAVVTHNRWDRLAAYGPIDWTARTNTNSVTPLTWVDNAYEDTGQVIASPQ